METQNIQILIEKYLSDQVSPEEKQLVDDFYASFEANKGLTEQLDKEDLEVSRKQGFSSVLKALNL